MRFGGRRTSDNVESQRGMGFGRGGGGGLGGGASLLFGLVASRFGIGGVVVLFLLFALFGGLGDFLGGGGQQAVAPQGRTGESAANVCQSDEVTRFSCQVLASTEEQWGAIYQAAGARYAPPRLVFYTGGGRSGCGAADAQMGPFYCPADQRIYLDTSFFAELARRFGAPGDCAQAYVIAHEVGHHIQPINGTSERIRRAQSAVREGDANAMQVQMELQADCLAGVWAHHAETKRDLLEPGDAEEGLAAAAAVGDDRIQRRMQGQVVPESFTHGSAEQRMTWFRRGFGSGDPRGCDTFAS